ncbi:unnamed protein product [Phytophthora fragariaefolia]|uniref:Unnamed protein product n=1 Tax=Phytophthora fragariaefolia TaxID=1490495 RepID=A0A9W6YET0_9STRA|nr:unnamed protein product [Phytophthora fragariaefolia]
MWGLFRHHRSLYGWPAPRTREEAVQQCVQPVVETARALGVAITLQAIWRRRADYWDPVRDASVHHASAILTGRLRQAYINVRLLMTQISPSRGRHEAAKIVSYALLWNHSCGRPSRPIALSKPVTILFFDGGSRGNPGPGGSGCLIVLLPQVEPPPTVEWMASISLASRRTTNNIAEYRALCAGLNYALTNGLTDLHVLGDSAMILAQMRRRRPPRAPHLRSIYAQCRGIADRVHVFTWNHHLRAFNKAADMLANIAMDDRKSRQVFRSDQPTRVPRWAEVTRLLDGDLRQWRDAYFTGGAEEPDADAEQGRRDRGDTQSRSPNLQMTG